MKLLPQNMLVALAVSFVISHVCIAGISPEVHEDGRVTFRVQAPKADKVLVLGDWLKQGEELAMIKGEDGNWTVTTGPFPPGNHIYGFEIDGVQMPDPENASVKLRASRAGSFFHIPGNATWESRMFRTEMSISTFTNRRRWVTQDGLQSIRLRTTVTTPIKNTRCCTCCMVRMTPPSVG